MRFLIPVLLAVVVEIIKYIAEDEDNCGCD